jgi:hypothetical protein
VITDVVRRVAGLVLFLVAPTETRAQPRQTSADDYTRYELLDPSTAKFLIRYHVTATTPGATVFFNPIRPGSEASDEAAVDPTNGSRLSLTMVTGAVARAGGLSSADSATHYLRVELPRPVPANGEIRIRIDKTYRDPKSYVLAGDTLIFSRSLSIPRNAVVLPAGYELIGVNYPSQVLTEPDGRVLISFINPGPDPVSLVVRGVKRP